MTRPKSFYAYLLFGGLFGFFLGVFTHQYLVQILSFGYIGPKVLSFFVIGFITSFAYLFTFLSNEYKIRRVIVGVPVVFLTILMLYVWDWDRQRFDFGVVISPYSALEKGKNCTGDGLIGKLTYKNQKFFTEHGIAIISVSVVDDQNLELKVLSTGVVYRGQLMHHARAVGIASLPETTLGWIVCDR
jgi:hypothetical protein